MNRNSNEDYKLSILVDKKHGTYYCVDSKGRSYIKTDGKTFKGENRK